MNSAWPMLRSANRAIAGTRSNSAPADQPSQQPLRLLDRRLGVAVEPSGLKGGLHQPALPQPMLALADKHVVAREAANRAAVPLQLRERLTVRDQDVADQVGMIDQAGADTAPAGTSPGRRSHAPGWSGTSGDFVGIGRPAASRTKSREVRGESAHGARRSQPGGQCASACCAGGATGNRVVNRHILRDAVSLRDLQIPKFRYQHDMCAVR